MSHVSVLAFSALFCIAPLAEQQQAPAPPPITFADAQVRVAVNWHASYDEALAASRVSGRPVMLFQLLGNLDDALC